MQTSCWVTHKRNHQCLLRDDFNTFRLILVLSLAEKIGKRMPVSFVFSLVFYILSATYAEDCNPQAVIKSWQTLSPCPRREKLGVLIGYGYNLNLPHINGDFATLGIDPIDIRKGVIMQGPAECDCTQSFCLTSEQSDRLFQINVDRAQKKILSLIRSSSEPMPCCDIQNSLSALAFTFGIDFLTRVPNGLSLVNNGDWQKLGTALLKQSWCIVTDHCSPFAQRITRACSDVTDNFGCSPPTPQACDSTGTYCCAANNTCCQYHSTGRSVSHSRRNLAYWCCPLEGAACCSSSNSCCPKQNPVCCGGTNTCCFVDYPVCCFPGTSDAYCCTSSSPVCLGDQHCGSLDPNVKPVRGKSNKAKEPEIVH